MEMKDITSKSSIKEKLGNKEHHKQSFNQKPEIKADGDEEIK